MVCVPLAQPEEREQGNDYDYDTHDVDETIHFDLSLYERVLFDARIWMGGLNRPRAPVRFGHGTTAPCDFHTRGIGSLITLE